MRTTENFFPAQQHDDVSPRLSQHTEVFKHNNETPLLALSASQFTNWDFADYPADDQAVATRPSEAFLKQQIIHLFNSNHQEIAEDQFDPLYQNALEQLATLFTVSEESSVAKWNKMAPMLRMLSALHVGLLTFYGCGYPILSPSPTLAKSELKNANFDLIYLHHLIEYLAEYFNLSVVRRRMTGPMQTLAIISQSEGFAIPTDFFAHMNLQHLSASQRRHFDLAALLDNYLRYGNALSANANHYRVDSIATLRHHFLLRLTDEIKINRIIKRVLHPLVKKSTDIHYDSIAFVNASGKNVDYFKNKVISASRQRGLNFTDTVLNTATEHYFTALGESTQFNIGTLEHSLHSICLRYDDFFLEPHLISPITLEQLKQRLDDYDRRWATQSVNMLKPSVMAGLHLIHSRGVRFVDDQWGARLWESTLKAEITAILGEDQDKWSLCPELPFANLSQNAGDAFHAFSSFKAVDLNRIECVKTVLTSGENRLLSLIKSSKIKAINDKILALRKKYLANEYLISNGDPKKAFSLAEGYLNEWLDSRFITPPSVDTKEIALKALHRKIPGKQTSYFTAKTLDESFKLGMKWIDLKVNHIERFISNARVSSAPEIPDTYPNARQEFNAEIDYLIKENMRWIKVKAHTNLRMKAGPFGDAELQAEIYSLIETLLAGKIEARHEYNIGQILVSLIPFIGSVKMLYDAIVDDSLAEFLSGAFFLSLDTLMFIASPLRAAMTAEELTAEAGLRTSNLQSAHEKIQLKSLIHVTKQLNVDNNAIEDLIKGSQLNSDTREIVNNSAFRLVPPEHTALARKVIAAASREDGGQQLWRGYKVVVLEKEHRIIPITNHPNGSGQVEVSWHTGKPVHPLRTIYQLSNGKFLSARWLWLGDNLADETLLPEHLLDGQAFNIVDDIDREFPRTQMQSNGVVVDTIRQVSDINELTIEEAQNFLTTAFRYQSDLPTLVEEALHENIANKLELAARRSPIFRRLLQIKKADNAKPIIFDLSEQHPYPRAYPRLDSEEGLADIAKEDLKEQAKQRYIAGLKMNNPNITVQEIDNALLSPAVRDQINQAPTNKLISDRLAVLREKHRSLIIEVPLVEKIQTLRYFSADGEYPFTLTQAIFHELIHSITGLKDISSTIVSGLSPAARGVGSVDHLTDLILFEMGENIPMRVLYGTEELKQSTQDLTVRSGLFKRAFRHTEAQRRIIDDVLKPIVQQANEQSVIFGVPIQQRTTVVQMQSFARQKAIWLDNRYLTDIAAKKADLQQITQGSIGLLRHIDYSALPDPLRIAYQADFNDLLTKSDLMMDSALMWWNKNGRVTAPWKIIIEPAEQEIATDFAPILINHQTRLVKLRHHDGLFYLSMQGAKPLESSRLAALALQKLFSHPFISELPQTTIKLDERGGEVYRANQVLKQAGRSKLLPQISNLVINGNDQVAKEKLMLHNSYARLATWKENTFLSLHKI